MKKILIGLLFFVLVSSLYAEKFRIGWYPLEPLMVNPGRGRPPTGLLIDYYEKHVATKMGVEIEWYGPYPFNRLIDMLEKHDIDAVSQFTKTPEWEAKYLFAKTPLTYNTACLIVRKDSPLLAIKRVEDLYGQTIGFYDRGYIPPAFKNERITFDLTRSYEYRKVNLDKLIAKRFNAMLDINYLSISYYINLNKYGDRVKILSLPTAPIPVYSMFGRTDKGRRLLLLYDTAHTELTKLKVFETMTKKYQ